MRKAFLFSFHNPQLTSEHEEDRQLRPGEGALPSTTGACHSSGRHTHPAHALAPAGTRTCTCTGRANKALSFRGEETTAPELNGPAQGHTTVVLWAMAASVPARPLSGYGTIAT